MRLPVYMNEFCKTNQNLMKLKLPLVLVCAFIVFKSPAQIVLTTADLPVVGDVSILRKISSTSTSPGPSGAGQTWNFSSLAGNLDTLWYINPATTPNGASFPTSNLCVKHGSNYYDYYTNGSPGQKLVGFDGDDGVINLLIQGFEFPLLTYGNSLAHNFRAKFNVVSSDTYDAVFIAHNSTADAWGTITTPAGTANVLRIYTTETRYDSSYVSGVGSQTATSTGYYYKWYAKGLGWPVMEISWGTLRDPDFEQTIYANNLSGVTGVKENNQQNIEINVCPNPFTSFFTLQSAQPLNNASLCVFDVTGQQVYQNNGINGNKITVEAKLNSGIYFYNLTDVTGTLLSTGKLVAE